MPTSTTYRIGDKIQNRWEVHKILRGGMGIVYVVYNHEFKEAFAAKTYQDRFMNNEAARARFTQEALPQVLRFAMQFCDGMLHAYSM